MKTIEVAGMAQSILYELLYEKVICILFKFSRSWLGQSEY
jgi:hypothetical protein